MKHNRKPPPGNVRRVVSTGQNIRGIITNKVGRLIQFESWAERTLLLCLDFDPDVLDYGSQPEQFQYHNAQGKQYRYTPDFIVWRQDGSVEIHEVTLSMRRSRPDIQRRENAAVEICRTRNWRYIIHTEKTLPGGNHLANLLALFRYRPTIYENPEVMKFAQQQLVCGSQIVLPILASQTSQALNLPEVDAVTALCHMLWHNRLITNLNRLIFTSTQAKFSQEILVWLPPQPELEP